MTPPDEREYVLGTSNAELVRLGVQHRLWAAQAHALWERAGFRLGQTLLDVGCGPGYAAFDLAQLVGSGGRVLAVDASARFVRHLDAQIAARGVTNVETRVVDVQALDLERDSIDGAYARWVLCFVRDPAAVVAGVARGLRPGAAFAIQDYFNYNSRTLAIAPRSAALERVVEAVEASWRAAGGDPDVVARLPGIAADCGLELREIRPILRVAHPASPLWHWPDTFFRNVVPALVAGGFLTAADQRAFEADWAERSRDPHTFFCSPPVFDVILARPART